MVDVENVSIEMEAVNNRDAKGSRAPLKKAKTEFNSGSFEDLLYDFDGFKQGLRPSQLDDLWQLMGTKRYGFHQKDESKRFMEQVLTAMGAEKSVLLENWDDTFSKHSNDGKAIDKKQTAQMIMAIHAWESYNLKPRALSLNQ